MTEGPRALQAMLRLEPKRCRIDYALERDGGHVCRKCGRPVKHANTRSGWRHA